LYSHNEDAVSGDDFRLFEAMIERRRSGEPVAYITGHRGFWDMTLEVSKATLIPRPETEVLVEAVLNCRADTQLTVIDLGTGSGAIAIALARERRAWQIYASDNSSNALAVAKRNADKWAAGRIGFICADWLAALGREQFDIIVCNPPYVAPEDPHLPALRHEPVSALVAGNAGLGDLKRVIEASVPAIRAGGHIFLEHGFDQQGDVARALEQAGFTSIQRGVDLAGNPRFVSGRYQP
jgi:release factor glutamine methyltransferase